MHRGVHSPLSQWCILHIPPISTKFIHLPPISAKFRFFRLIYVFLLPPFSTMMHLCIMLYMNWTPLQMYTWLKFTWLGTTRVRSDLLQRISILWWINLAWHHSSPSFVSLIELISFKLPITAQFQVSLSMGLHSVGVTDSNLQINKLLLQKP